METNNIMEEAIEEVAVKAPNKILMGCGVAGITLLVGGLVYKFVAKPIVNKIKNKKEAEAETVEDGDYREVEVEE